MFRLPQFPLNVDAARRSSGSLTIWSSSKAALASCLTYRLPSRGAEPNGVGRALNWPNSIDDSAAGAEATVMTDQAAADQTEANNDAAAETDFAQAEADQTMNSWGSLAQSMAGHQGEAKTLYEWHKAQALDSWQTTADNNYKTYVSTVAGDEVTYATTDSGDFLSEAQAIDAADKSDGDDDADADQGLVNTLAGDEVAYETAAATATAAYQVAIAQAVHDDVVKIADAVDAYAHDGDATAYNNALAAAAAALVTAQSGAATTYDNTIGPATATQETNDADSLLSDAQTVADDDLADAKTADLQIDTYSKAERATLFKRRLRTTPWRSTRCSRATPML